QALFGSAQIEKQLALSFGGSDFDNTPVAQNEFVDFSLDPVHGKGHQTNTFFRVEALDGLHQADIAFLNQITEGESIAVVGAGNVHYKTQMGHNQLACSVEVAVVVEIFCQLLLLLGG